MDEVLVAIIVSLETIESSFLKIFFFITTSSFTASITNPDSLTFLKSVVKIILPIDSSDLSWLIISFLT